MMVSLMIFWGKFRPSCYKIKGTAYFMTILRELNVIDNCSQNLCIGRSSPLHFEHTPHPSGFGKENTL